MHIDGQNGRGSTPSAPEARVLEILQRRGASSAREIVDLTGLSKATISNAIASLRESGLVVESSVAESGGRGRPASRISLSPKSGTCVGVRLFIDSVRITVADLSHAILDERQRDFASPYSIGEATEAVAALVEESLSHLGLPRDRLLGIGIAVPGPLNPFTGCMVRSSLMPEWGGINIRAAFADALGCPVYVDNESNCSALAELTWGAGRGEKSFFFLKLDAGVGGAIVIDEQVIVGAAGGAGEIGHMCFDPHGSLCRCGNRGCLELYAGLEAVLAPARPMLGPSVTFETIAQRAADGDTGLAKLIEEVGAAAGKGLASACALLNPSLVIVGGRQVVAGEMLLEPLRRAFARHSHIHPSEVPPASQTRIVPGTFQNNQDAALGAVALVLHNQSVLAT